MKKMIALLMALAMCLVLCACTGTNNVPDETEHIPSETEIKNVEMVEIINNDGETEQLSGAELLEIHNNNPVKFESKYYGAAVTVVSKVKNISGRVIYNGDDMEAYIELEGGWFIEAASESDVIELSVGDLVKVTGKIHYVFGSTIYSYIQNNDTTTIELYSE